MAQRAVHNSVNEIGAYGQDRRNRMRSTRPASKKRSKVEDKPDDATTSTAWDVTPSTEEIIQLLKTELTVGPEIAGPALNLGRSSTYRALRRQQIACNKIGNKFIIATSWLRQVLGLEPTSMPAPVSLPATNIVATPTAPKQVTRPKRRRHK
jgi:hypothetical protein